MKAKVNKFWLNAIENGYGEFIYQNSNITDANLIIYSITEFNPSMMRSSARPSVDLYSDDISDGDTFVLLISLAVIILVILILMRNSIMRNKRKPVEYADEARYEPKSAEHEQSYPSELSSINKFAQIEVEETVSGPHIVIIVVIY